MIGELTRCYQRLVEVGLSGLTYDAEHDAIGTMYVPRWELAVAYFYGLSYLAEDTKYDQHIRTTVTSRVGLTSWLEYQRLGVSDMNSKHAHIVNKD